MKRKSRFFLIIGFVGVLAVLIGFAKTFFIPVASGTFHAPFTVHLHGFFAFLWIILFVVQSQLIHSKNFKTHKSLGFAGLFIALGATITLIPVGLFAVNKELASGLGETAISGFLGILTSGTIFLCFVLCGILYRKNAQAHKRLMLLATILLLWPAWFRFRHYFPAVERPDIWFAVVLADSLIVISWIWDKVENGKTHPVLLYGGVFIIAEHTLELIMFDSAVWRQVAKVIYSALSN